MSEESRYFLSRIDDLVKRAEKGSLSSTPFLSPEEASSALAYLKYHAPEARFGLYGGYPDAERRVLVLFPEYYDEESFETSEVFTALFIKTGGYVPLTHSSYMGAVLNCGIERSCVGDIMLTDGGAVVFVLNRTAQYLLSTDHPLYRVGRDKVVLSYAQDALVSSLKREYDEIIFTVSSCRIDCFTAEVSRLSREKAYEVLSRGDVSLNYSRVTDRAQRFDTEDVISVRGHGKYIVKEITETRKGRMRVLALKYK